MVGGAPRARRPSQALIAAERRRARNRSVVRDLVVAVLAVALMWVAWAVREVANDARPPALAVTGRLDDVFHRVQAGHVDLGTTPRTVGAGVRGARFPRPTLGDRWVLTAPSGGECYVLWWDVEGRRRTRVLAPDMACQPSTDAMSARPTTYRRLGDAVVDDPGERNTWAGVLPDPVRMRWWFLPALIAGGGILLSALVRISIALLTGAPSSATRR